MAVLFAKYHLHEHFCLDHKIWWDWPFPIMNIWMSLLYFWGQFHQHAYAQLLFVQIPKAQKDSEVISVFCAFGIFACQKAKGKPREWKWEKATITSLEPPFSTLVVWNQFHHHFKSSFCPISVWHKNANINYEYRYESTRKILHILEMVLS